MIMSDGVKHHHHLHDDDGGNDGNEKTLDFSTIEVSDDKSETKIDMNIDDVDNTKSKETLIFKDKLRSSSHDHYDDNVDGIVVKSGKVNDDTDTTTGHGNGYHHGEAVVNNARSVVDDDDGCKDDEAGLMKAYRSTSQRQAFISDLIKV